MAGQLIHIAETARLPNVSVRVLPLRAGLHRAMACGSFTILDFPPGRAGQDGEPTTIYSDNITGARYLDKPAEVAAYDEAWAGLVDLSLDESASAAMLAAIIKEYDS